jgi:hypothetical protein
MIRVVARRAWVLGETIYVGRLIYGERGTKPREVVPEEAESESVCERKTKRTRLSLMSKSNWPEETHAFELLPVNQGRAFLRRGQVEDAMLLCGQSSAHNQNR